MAQQLDKSTTELVVDDGSDSSPTTSSSIYKSTCHPTHRRQSSRSIDKKWLIGLSVICLLLMAAALAGAIISNSLVIATLAADLLTDFGGFMVSLITVWIASKPRTPKMSFGFYRAETIGAVMSMLSIWLVTGIVAYMAVERLIYKEYKLDGLVMVCSSGVGVVASMFMGVILQFYKFDTLESPDAEKPGSSKLVKFAVMQTLIDLVPSVVVLVASLVMFFFPDLIIIDPVCSLLLSSVFLFSTFFLLKDIFYVLMQGAPRHLDFADVINVLLSIEGVKKIHNLRMWSLTVDKAALSAHLVVRPGENHSDILSNAVKVIGEHFDIYELTLQIEEDGTEMETCTVCT